MQRIEDTIAALGDEPPLVTGGRSGPPDRREVSARWLSGTFLTGITSSVLMGVALFAALDGREVLATPPEIMNLSALDDPGGKADTAKAQRLVAPRTVARATDRRRLQLSTMTRAGDREVVRTLPFVQVKMALAAGHTTSRNYPAFDPLEVFAEDGAAQAAAAAAPTSILYGAKVESEISLHTVEFPIATANFDENSALSAEEVERLVRNTGAILTDGDVQLAALHYVDPQRFGDNPALQPLGASYGVRIIQENVSVAPREAEAAAAADYAEDIVALHVDTEAIAALEEAGYGGADAEGMAQAFATLLRDPVLKAGSALRLGIETRDEISRIVRASLYDGRNHVLTIALDDHDQYVKGNEPEPNPAIQTAFESNQPAAPRARSDLPTVYDGIYRAAFAYGLNRPLTRQLIKMLAAEVDYQARLHPSDQLEVFFSQPDEDNQATEASEILFVRAGFNGNTRSFYRFQMEDGAIDYFDEEGRSARQFLLRNPVPNGKFRSGFGGRRHPILGYTRMHTGVDWAAPRGTPIIASGNGVVEKAGWAGGYGRQTIIRHANGYKTSYNHQNAIAKGVTEGARVRQGQVIGYVGTTGLSTGPHLHYELIVNGTKVDPMRVRLPVGRVLKGEELEAFMQERERIDTLLREEEGNGLKMASARMGER